MVDAFEDWHAAEISKQQTKTTLGAGNRRSQRMFDFFKGELFWEHPGRSQEMSISPNVSLFIAMIKGHFMQSLDVFGVSHP